MAVIVSQCCCGCSLKTGTILIAIVELIGLFILTGLTAYTSSQNYVSYEETVTIFNTTKVFDTTTIVNPEDKSSEITNIIHYVSWSIQIVITIVMLIGAIKEIPRLLPPWMIMTVITLIVDAVLYLIGIIANFYYKDRPAAFRLLGSWLGSLLLNIYYLVVVYSYREQLLASSATFTSASYRN